MRPRPLTVFALGALAVLLSTSPAPAAPKTPGAKGPAPQRMTTAAAARAALADPVDLSGVWFPELYENSDFEPYPSLTPQAKPFYDDVRAKMAAGKSTDDGPAFCIPPSVPRILRRRRPVQILRSARDLVMLFEFGSQMRFVHMDGRPHVNPDDVAPAFNGDSIGHWEGKTLVIDTANLVNKVASFNVSPERGVRVTPHFHVIERWTLSPDKTLITIAITMVDPTVFAKPWQVHILLHRRDDLEVHEEQCIAAANRETVGADGAITFKPPAGK